VPVEPDDEALRRDDAVALFDPVTEEPDVDPPGAPEPVSGRRCSLDSESVAVRLDQLDRYERRLGLVVVAEEDEDLVDVLMLKPGFGVRAQSG